mgnify:CR=1 FL=1
MGGVGKVVFYKFSLWVMLLSFRILHFSDEELYEFIRKIVTASQAGVLATNNVTFDSSWTFGQAFFFVGTLVTTVGRFSSARGR